MLFSKTNVNIKWDPTLPKSDQTSHDYYADYRHIYDRLWIANSQHIDCGLMNRIPNNFPVFVKPLKNLNGGNRDCYKVNSVSEFNKLDHRVDLFWCEFIEGSETSWDIVVINGVPDWWVKHQIDHMNDDYLEKYKVTNIRDELPYNLIEWIKTHLGNYTGNLNLQCRGKDDIIIEAGLRMDGGGDFLNMPQLWNEYVPTENINELWESNGTSWTRPGYPPSYVILQVHVSNCVVFPLPMIFYNMLVDDKFIHKFYIDRGENEKSISQIITRYQHIGEATKLRTHIEKLNRYWDLFIKITLVLTLTYAYYRSSYVWASSALITAFVLKFFTIPTKQAFNFT